MNYLLYDFFTCGRKRKDVVYPSMNYLFHVLYLKSFSVAVKSGKRFQILRLCPHVEILKIIALYCTTFTLLCVIYAMAPLDHMVFLWM
jgi:hypothetical protein